MRMRFILNISIPIILIASVGHAADPTTRPSSPATTQFASVANIFDAIPTELRPPEPVENATDLQTEALKEKIARANDWLKDNAIGRPIHAKGIISSVRPNPDQTIQVEVNSTEHNVPGISCTFPASQRDVLATLSQGTGVEMTGTITQANYELNGEVSFNGLGIHSVTKIMFQFVNAKDCKLIHIDTDPAPPTAVPTALPATLPTTTRFASVAAVFEAVPAELHPGALPAHPTSLQSETFKQQGDAENNWLERNAKSRGVHVAGKVNDITSDSDGLTLSVDTENDNQLTVNCKFTAADKPQLLRLNKQDKVEIDGTISTVQIGFYSDGSTTRTIAISDCRLPRK